MTQRKKTAYGRYDERYGFILSPLRSQPFMVPVPVAIFATRGEAESAAKAHGYKVEWQIAA